MQFGYLFKVKQTNQPGDCFKKSKSKAEGNEFTSYQAFLQTHSCSCKLLSDMTLKCYTFLCKNRPGPNEIWRFTAKHSSFFLLLLFLTTQRALADRCNLSPTAYSIPSLFLPPSRTAVVCRGKSCICLRGFLMAFLFY